MQLLGQFRTDEPRMETKQPTFSWWGVLWSWIAIETTYEKDEKLKILVICSILNIPSEVLQR